MIGLLLLKQAQQGMPQQQGMGNQPPGPPPRPGLEWKPQTHRWIRPHDGEEFDHEGTQQQPQQEEQKPTPSITFESEEEENKYHAKNIEMYNTIVDNNKKVLEARDSGQISPEQAKGHLDKLQSMANTLNERLGNAGMGASDLMQKVEESNFHDETADMYNTLVHRSNQLTQANKRGEITQQRMEMGHTRLKRTLERNINDRLQQSGAKASDVIERAHNRNTDYDSIEGYEQHQRFLPQK